MSARRAAAGVVTALALALMLATASAAGAATYTATTFADHLPASVAACPPDAVADGCSLRGAVEASNQTGANDEIVLAAGRYELNTDLEEGAQELSVNRATGGDSAGSLLIRGAGARATTIDGNASTDRWARVFRFNAGSIAELRDLGVTGGYFGDARGGAITVLDDSRSGNDAQVTLTRTAVFDNHDADDQGGAIENRGKLTIVQSVLSGNTAGTDGGAIENMDELTLINSTVSGNEASGNEQVAGDGGGIHNSGRSSELRSESPVELLNATTIPDRAPFLLVENSTIAGNRAPRGVGGGVSTDRDLCSLRASLGGDCTDSPSALALFHNSIVSDNTADANKNCFGNDPQNSKYASSQGYNLEDGDSCLFTATGDKLAATNIDPLADNGGGTDTHKLKESSVAVDGGDPQACEATDQRGVTRPQRVRCDIGAFELEPVPVTPTQPQPQPQTPIAEPGCTDPAPPITSLRKSGLVVTANTVKLTGTSRDPDPCASGVQRVEVSMARVRGTDLNCRFIRSSTRFVITPFQNCRQPVLFTAGGTTNWTFTFNVRLSKGKYRAQARGYDVARNKETPTKRRNIIYFEVK